jgi:ribosomal protein S18 acetylase RimI-like enzyme
VPPVKPTQPVAVREAVPSDAASIREVALAAWRATYAGLLEPEIVERFLARAYTEQRIGLRIERHAVFVAGRPPAEVEAYAECATHDDHVQLVAIYAHPDALGRGLGSALLAAVVAAHPGEDVAADVLVGNDLAERFYEARGFVRGDLLVEELAGEPIHERRWWLRGAT